MPKKTVYLLQDTKEINDSIERAFTEDGKFQVVGSAIDGICAIPEIAEKKPDVVLLELVLPGYDGLSVISKIKEMGIATKIIVLSALSREEIVSSAITAGANYFMAKPINEAALLNRVADLFEEKPDAQKGGASLTVRKPSLDEKISKIFINVGIPPHIKGYTFLREGVKMAVDEPEIINNITKKLYPKIGEKYLTTASKVERAIRHAIEVAWNRGRIESINSILGVRAYVGAEKPTNGEFIALVADKMLLEEK